MIPNFESFLEATPDQGVIIVEYYWQPPLAPSRKRGRGDTANGRKTSMIFFKRLRATDPCWCGSKRHFGRCHRREDDWTFVTFDSDQQSYSPVILLERTFTHSDFAGIRESLEANESLLPIESNGDHATWAIPYQPLIENEIGKLILGTVTLDKRELLLETNSEHRFDHLTGMLREWLGDSIRAAHTRRAEPQKAFGHGARHRRG
ncbi:MAG: SEC-C domain-containing protein [Anaerolineae bacterium]